ncbi:MAG TPA: cyclase family protein [Terriglobia bacterium]|jgi:arylformamidase|nr:cyclase family protein [Terriglobia bacterium]
MNFKIIDLTHKLLPGEEQYPVEVKQRGKPRETPTGDIMHDVYMWSHSGTHVEVSLHFYAGGKDTSDFPPETFVGSAIRLDFRHKQTNEPITLTEIQAAGDVREGDIVVLWEGRDHLYRTKESHSRPYLTEEAARWLALEKKIKLLGTDSSGFEVRGVSTHPNHHLFFKAGVDIPVVECLCRLDKIPSQRFFFVGLPIPAKGLDASPIRAIALDIEGCWPSLRFE